MSTEIQERGPEVAITCVFLISGIAVAYWVDLGFTRLTSQISWVHYPVSSIPTMLLILILAISNWVSNRLCTNCQQWHLAAS
jgi:hypothetical protein